jgi:hypothetical protein
MAHQKRRVFFLILWGLSLPELVLTINLLAFENQSAFPGRGVRLGRGAWEKTPVLSPVQILYWGQAQETPPRPVLDLKDLGENEALIRLTLQDVPDSSASMFVAIEQSDIADKSWKTPMLRWMESGECLKILKNGLLRISVWRGYDYPAYEGWINWEASALEIVMGSQAWNQNLKAWKPLVLCGKTELYRQPYAEAILVQRFQGQIQGPSLVVCGGSELWPQPKLESPQDWLNFAQFLQKKELLLYLKGFQRLLTYQGKRWSPMVLLAASGLLQGICPWDVGDESHYREWLAEGHALGLLFDAGDPAPYGPLLVQNRCYVSGNDMDLFAQLRSNRLICAQDLCFELTLELLNSEARTLLNIGEVTESTGSYLPKLWFECGTMTRGIRRIELYRGSKLIQVSDLRTPLREGRSVFASETFSLGDAVTVALVDLHGRRWMSNPIFFGKSSATPLNQVVQNFCSPSNLLKLNNDDKCLSVLEQYQLFCQPEAKN